MSNADYKFFQTYKSCEDLRQIIYNSENTPENAPITRYQRAMLCKLIEELQSEYGKLNLTREEYAGYMDTNDKPNGSVKAQLDTYVENNALGYTMKGLLKPIYAAGDREK